MYDMNVIKQKISQNIYTSFYARRKVKMALDELNVKLWNTIPAKQ